MKIRGRVGLLLGGLLLVALVASGAAAQGAPWRIVQAGDGTLYLLKDGARYAIVGEPVGDDELDAYADGGVIDGIQLPSALMAAAPTVPAVMGEVPSAEIALPAELVTPAPGAEKTSGTGTPAAPPAATAPQFVSIKGAAPGQTASVTVQAAPGGSCSLAFGTPGPRRAAGATVGQQTAGSTGLVTWSFLIEPATTPGNGTDTVTCGSATISSPIPIGGGLSR